MQLVCLTTNICNVDLMNTYKTLRTTVKMNLNQLTDQMENLKRKKRFNLN